MMSIKKSPLLGIPTTLSVADLASRRPGFVEKTEEEKQRIRAQLASGQNAPHKPTHMDVVRSGLDVPSPTSLTPPPRMNEEVDDSWAALPVTAIHGYEHNPRRTSNSSFTELKESIRINGILQPLTVTRRPNDSMYVLFAGGNTRLQAIQELWAETADPKFSEVRVITKAWRGDAAVLLAHMAENTQRNDMTFWDRACGTLAIKARMEEETGKTLSLREFEATLKAAGMPIGLNTISMFKFAMDRLSHIGPWLSGLAVRVVQPKLNLMLKLSAHYSVDTDCYYDEIISPLLHAYAAQINSGEHEFSAETLLERCESALATRFHLKDACIKKMLSTLERFPDMQSLDLFKACQQQAVEPFAPAAEPSDTRVAVEPEQTRKVSNQMHPVAQDGAATVQPSVPGTHSVSNASSLNFDPDSDDEEPLLMMHRPINYADDVPLLELCQHLVAKAGLGMCYEEAPGMPLGFYMGFPSDGVLDIRAGDDDRRRSTSRQASWWVLAAITGQFNAEICREAMPEGTRWRSLLLEEEDTGTMDALELTTQHIVGPQGPFIPISWLLAFENSVAELVMKIILTARKQGMFVEDGAL